ncbi:MAG: pyridoxamine 5'-phosphate oxidase family protein [Pirellulales bacterium]
MGATYSELNDKLREFIAAQQMFFVATAPLAAEGHLNLSPKGLDLFRVLDARTVAYLDLAGSGIETVAHVLENGRIVLMFCALEGAPKIVRLHGRGRVVEPEDADWPGVSALFPRYTGARTVVVVELARVADSCGFGVPLYEYQGQRKQLVEWADKKGPEAIKRYSAEHNRESIDGLPGLRNV